jgi:hypothetical protein
MDYSQMVQTAETLELDEEELNALWVEISYLNALLGKLKFLS